MRAGDHRPWIGDVFLERFLIPSDPRILVRIRIAVVRRGTCLLAVETVELRTDLILHLGPYRMAKQAFSEQLLTGCGGAVGARKWR